MNEKFIRKTYVYGTEFWSFYNSQPKAVQDKIDWVIDLIRNLRVIPEKFFKSLKGSDGLFEIRVKVGSNIYRIFSFFDEGNLVILLHGFQKKSQKTPTKEIEKAKRLRYSYYEDKKNR